MFRFTAFFLSLLIISTMVIPVQQVWAADPVDQTSNGDIIRTAALSYKLKSGTDFIPLTAPYTIPNSTLVEKYHAKYTFALADNEDEEGAPHRTMKSGDYYYITLPSLIGISAATGGTILGNESRELADYSFEKLPDDSWRIKIEFKDYIDNLNEFLIHGELEFDFTIDMTSVPGGDQTSVYIPIDQTNGITIEITKPVPPPTTPVSLQKSVASYNNQTRQLVWNIKMMPEIGVFSGCVFEDTIDVSKQDLVSVKHGSVTLVMGTDYQYDSTTGHISYTVPSGRDGASYQNIVITTAVKSDVYAQMLPTTITNQASLTGGDNDVSLTSNEASQTITPSWLGKSGTLFQGNRIKWTITANSTNQKMFDAVITDSFQSDVRLDKSSVLMGSTVVAVYDDAHVPASDTEVYGIYTQNADGTSQLKIYLPRGKANASTDKKTFTLVTDVVAPTTITSTNPKYYNIATLDCKYVTEGDGEGTLPTVNIDQVGVAVPYISVTKANETLSAEDKRNGTISWKISAVSNVSDYGKTQIVDTLPDDQDFLPDEIYWGSQKLDATTSPKAEISADGRKLTITFDGPKALITQQFFTVKTKIKTEVYGENLNRNFNNVVAVSIYSTDNSTNLKTVSASDNVLVVNNVITKSSETYNGGYPQTGGNPRLNFAITVNENLMPLQDVKITDDLSAIITQFKKSGESSFTNISGVKWTYVDGSLTVSKSAGTRDSLNLADIAASALYAGDILSVSFGDGVAVNDKYVIRFTVELDVSQNDIFKQNGVIRCLNNIAGVEATGLKTGVVTSPPTGSSNEIKNELLGKSGVHMVAEQQILWTINLNQYRVSLNNPRVEDTLPLGLTLDPTSIRLYKDVIGSNGAFLTGSSIAAQGTPVSFNYTYLPATGAGMEGRYTLSVELPENNVNYILVFATDINKSLLGTQIVNNAFYVGDSGSTENNSGSTVTISGSSGGGSTTKTSITVNKYSKDDGAAVPGATYSLYWLRNGDPDDAVFVRTVKDNTGAVVIRGLTRGESYTITESSPPQGYILDDPNPVTIVTPTTGTEDMSAISFYDTPVKTGSWTPAAVKVLDGKSIIRPFHFEIYDASGTLMTGVTSTSLPGGEYSVLFSMSSGIAADGVTTFSDSHEFSSTDAPGTQLLLTEKTFYMKETESTSSGYDFDDTVFTFVVKIYNVKGQPSLKVVVENGAGEVISDDSGLILAGKAPVFRNSYSADGSIRIDVKKVLTGQPLASGAFSFELYEGSALLHSSVCAADGWAYFNLSYDEGDVGDKTYTIKEINSALPWYTYDSAVYTVVVGVTDDDDNGSLSCSIKSITKITDTASAPASEIVFNNTYTATEVEAQITAKKSLTGHSLASGQFSFVLDSVTSAGEFVSEVARVQNAGTNITFPSLTFTQYDIGMTYYYQVSEVNDAKPGYTYDLSVYTVAIQVFDNGDGTLRTQQTITKNSTVRESILFNNRYNGDGTVQITASKSLAGSIMQAGQFSFSLQRIDIATGMIIGSKITAGNNAEGEVIFPVIKYTEADADNTYYYSVTELDENKAGYTYDPTQYIVQVKVTDNGNGTLSAWQSITSPTGKSRITFSNYYSAADYSDLISAKKVLNGRVLTDGQFSFTLNRVAEDGTVLQKIQQVGNSSYGDILFDPIRYTQQDAGKTFLYTVTENNDAATGYSYDPSVYTVKVIVTDNGEGELRIAKTIQKDGTAAENIVFSNNYTARDASVTLSAKKTLKRHELKDGQFTYKLTYKGEDGRQDVPVQEVKNSADGSIRFSPLYYSTADAGRTYIFTVSEVNDAKAGYEYDNTVYTLKVSVKDNGNGTLSAGYTVTKQSGEREESVQDITFSNVYTAFGSLTLSAVKKLDGKAPADKAFSFTLMDGEGRVLQTVQNDKDGFVLFKEIPYSLDTLGQHRYTVREKSGGDNGIIYDKTVYNVSVSVSDNEDGKLKISYEAKKEGADKKSDLIVFNNVTVEQPTTEQPTTAEQPTNEQSTTQKPTTEGDEYEDVGDGKIPTAPLTGDIGGALFYILLAGISATAFVSVGAIKSKRSKNK